MSYSIAEAARRSGLSIDTLRYYERIKLLDPPARDTAGRRAYSDADLAWLEFLTKLRTTGMPIKMMREYAQLRAAGDASAGRRRAILLEQRRSVAERIAELQACMDVLNYKIENYDRICARVPGAAGVVREEISA
ncbi:MULTISPECIES: MerR family transcriptional regulator [Amycolatopsis]|uniref:DNA-binding transcriptional MerR regulator n=1 Tax=Amycolatopsis thermoflava TaxID=84480 RepID=A0A3N2GUH6_9PSEU|nr:MerR family transcriptional regulator [Amycolatopsis thermoflava]ROS40223.1 DNA-binding transcriptional MerR regulator [Amycolatopsis thermoflava]